MANVCTHLIAGLPLPTQNHLTQQQGCRSNLMPMPLRASLTFTVPLARAQLTQELAGDTDQQIPGSRQVGRAAGHCPRQLPTLALPGLACMPGAQPAPHLHPNTLRGVCSTELPISSSWNATANRSARSGLLEISNL